MSTVFVWLVFLSTIGAGIVGGVFFAFSTFVMPALGRIPQPQGIAAMQAINVKAINFGFMFALFGTGVCCLLLAIMIALGFGALGAGFVVAGALIYLAGVVLVTMVANVPRNNALARVDPSSGDSARLWEEYLRRWTAWNHVRTLAGILACGAFALAFQAVQLHGGE